MEFLKPYLLWGLLAMAIPVIIHLWNGRKGITIAWAATRFLEENDNVPVRHIQLKDYFLLFLRMLLLVLIVILVAQWYLSILDKAEKGTVYHFVQPADELISEFKFELENAVANGEQLYWLDSAVSPIDQLETKRFGKAKKAVGLDQALESVSEQEDEIHLYLINSSGTFESNFFITKQTPIIHLANNSEVIFDSKMIQIDNNKILYINDLNLLEVGDTSSESVDDNRILIENFKYFIDTLDAQNRRYIEAGLEAIASVYDLPLVEVNDQQEADLLFFNMLTNPINPEKIYWIFNHTSQNEYPNVYSLEIKGQGEAAALPETILSDLINYYGLLKNSTPLTKKQIESKFLTTENQLKPMAANTTEIIWILFLLTLIAERIIANYKQL